MQEELFGGLDDDDGLDKAFSAIQAMRGKAFIVNTIRWSLFDRGFFFFLRARQRYVG